MIKNGILFIFYLFPNGLKTYIIADSLYDCIRETGLRPEQRIFPVGYTGDSHTVQRAGRRIGIEIRPHDLRHHTATFTSRSGAPLEIMSKVILRRHSEISWQGE